MNICELKEIADLLESNPTGKKRHLCKKLNYDIDHLVSKYEYMYNKYIIKNKSVHSLRLQKEKDIAIVQNSIKMFFPYILAYNVAQMTPSEEIVSSLPS
ncbi:hypothetical protein QKU58_gp094 [Pyramimonas orientalis virus]|uniref:Uncharacterized protein n=1 Tax=Pyramimonas orientalis virus 01B TaxID=3134525 RepID=A0A7M3UNI0_9VIRU|nr:hypothetical protein QKU58_gp094 [Pyramimonas orientalis virus]QOI90237.1 hypothetical protein HWQ62_00100 [Pyramimonas orientalis virus]